MNEREIWEMVQSVVGEKGLELFDIDIPSRHASTLRVFVWRGNAAKEAGVSLGDCAAISKALTNDARFEELFPGQILIEVSSPGINRRLRRTEHFSAAVGERIKLSTYGGSSGKGRHVIGTLRSFNGSCLEIEEEAQKTAIAVNLNEIKDARIDFRFE